ncbi:bola-like protein-domain-containing protein [Blastocladiella britannica]|nr:bola-like protein-domain-containing protein [Blastocladiella britannica]
MLTASTTRALLTARRATTTAAMHSTASAAAPAVDTRPPLGPIASAIRDKLTAECTPMHLVIYDDSKKHAGHAAMKGLKPEETHFRVTVVSDAFSGKPLVQRHRLIYGILGNELRAGLHALQLNTRTPAEWDASAATEK